METKNISKSFYKRYFEQNALNRMAMGMLKFMWFKEGSFINPLKKNEILSKYIDEEIENFYKKNELNIPQIEFCITSKCTLKCRDCCALIPQLDKIKHIEMSFDEFKTTLDNLYASVDSIRHLVILGGEPLLNPQLPQMLEYAAQKENINFIQLITNGTMLPSEKLLEVLNKYNNRIYVYMSNYSDNKDLAPILKHEEIKKILSKNNVKLQKPENWAWLRELNFSDKKCAKDISQQKFLDCYRTKCNQIMNGYLDICSKATSAREMGLFEVNDSVNMNSKTLRQDLIDFYQKELMEACEYCLISDEKVLPAIQL